MAAFRPTLLVLGLALGHTLPPPPSPNACRRLFPPLSSHRSPLRLLREHMQQHARVLSSAEAGEASDGRGAASAEASVASWGRLWRELRLTARLGFVLPASAISLLLGVAELVAPRIRGDLFDTVVRSGVSFAQLAPQLRLLGLLAIVGWAGSIVSSVLFASARWASCMTGRLRLMQAVLAQEAAFFDRQPPGELASRLMSEPDRLEEIANRGIEKALNALLALCGGLGLMLLTEWRLALLALVLRAPLLARLAVVAGRVVGLYGVAQQRALNAANALAAEALAQAQTVVAHAAVRSVLDEYDGRVREYMRVIQCTLVSETALRFTRLAIDSLATWLMLAAGLHAVLHHRLTLGALTAFYTYSDVFARGCTSAQEVVSTLCTMRPACARYFELLDRSPAMAWGVGATPDRCEGALEVRNVSFAYAGRREGALHGVSFRVPAGTSLAIVGPSGAGKSSLLKLLLRLYDPDEGQVLLDGVDLRCLELGWMRSRFGYVPQQPLLFDATIAENVCFGERGTVDEAVAVALQAACAAAFVARLPDGVRTRVGEGGKHLSGGQRQRIAIARALVRRPRVLLWDEATSSLDGESERAVQATMQAALRDGHAGWRCSAVVVAHRLSSVLCADMVLVLREGRVEEFGSPSELSHAGGWFEQNFFGAS